MSRKHFSLLLAATLVAAALVLLVPGKTGKESSLEQTPLISGLAEQVNDIEWVRLTTAGGATVATLSRESGAWVVEEASAYRADWALVKSLLSALSRAEVIELKTSNPEYYPRLGVAAVSSAEAGGVMVEFASGSGLPAVIIGNTAQGRDGQYARLADSAGSVLIGAVIDIPRERNAWLDKTFIDIPDAEVVEFEITHPDGASVKAAKVSADDENFELQDVPAGREIKSEWSVDAPANSLAALDLQAVVPAAQFDWDNAVRFRIMTADGLVIEADLLAVEDQPGEADRAGHWLRLDASVYSSAVGALAGADVDGAATITRAEGIKNRVDGWAYQIPDYRFETMSRRMEDFLQPVAVE